MLAFWLVRTFVVLAGNQLPRAASVAIDSRVLLFTAVVTLAVGIVCGLWPLARMRTKELAVAVRATDTRTGSAPARLGTVSSSLRSRWRSRCWWAAAC